MPEDQRHRRTIRSFVRRAGRITASQQRALDEHWPAFGIEYAAEELDFDTLFGRRANRVLEIGFGNGDTLVMAAAASPDQDFIGVEVHESGIGHCLIKAQEANVTNLRLIARDAMEVLRNQVADASLTRINLLFPDPWPKKRHHKRRIINPQFLELAAARLAVGGDLYIATDWNQYAEHIDEVMGECTTFDLLERREHGGDQPLDRFTTKFEARGQRLGHRIVDWRFTRN